MDGSTTCAFRSWRDALGHPLLDRVREERVAPVLRETAPRQVLAGTVLNTPATTGSLHLVLRGRLQSYRLTPRPPLATTTRWLTTRRGSASCSLADTGPIEAWRRMKPGRGTGRPGLCLRSPINLRHVTGRRWFSTGPEGRSFCLADTMAVGRMTELIDSLLEFSRTRGSLTPTHGSLQATMKSSLNAVKSNPGFHNLTVGIHEVGNVEGWFDHRKLERAFFNLLLNACESVQSGTGKIDVALREEGDRIEITIVDNGRGIPPPIRHNLFEPFVSQGKENGTGLGLTVVQKIIQDHGGEVVIVSTSSAGTTFRITLPRPAPVLGSGDTVSSELSASAAPGTTNSTNQG